MICLNMEYWETWFVGFMHWNGFDNNSNWSQKQEYEIGNILQLKIEFWLLWRFLCLDGVLWQVRVYVLRCISITGQYYTSCSLIPLAYMSKDWNYFAFVIDFDPRISKVKWAHASQMRLSKTQLFNEVRPLQKLALPWCMYGLRRLWLWWNNVIPPRHRRMVLHPNRNATKRIIK